MCVVWLEICEGTENKEEKIEGISSSKVVWLGGSAG